MAKQIISRGSSANDGTGDNLREGANKINLNFNEVYTALGDGTTLNGTIKVADDSSTVMTLSANGETIRVLGGSGITSTVSGNDLTLAVDGTVLSASQTSTLTNKTLNLANNTITGTTAQFNTALSDGSFATLAGSESLTNKNLTGAGNTFPTLTIRDDSSSTDAVSLGETLRVTGGTGLTSSISSNNLTLAIDSTVATLTGSQTLTNKTIAAGSNTLSGITNSNLSGSAAISNANLANNSITLGDDTIALGATDTSIANLSLTGSTGTINLTSEANKIRFNYDGTGNLPTAATYEGMFAFDKAAGQKKPYVASSSGWVNLLTENDSVSRHADVNISGVADGNVLKWSSAQGRFNVAAESGGGYVAGTDLDLQGADPQDAGYFGFRSPDDSVVKTIVVTVASKTTEHYHHGTGSSNGYLLDGHESPALILAPGVYKFDQSDSSNSGHPLLFYYQADKTRQYTTGVTTNGTPGSSGAYTQIEVDFTSSGPIHYQCSAHANMGHVISLPHTNRHKLLKTTDKSNTGDGSDTTFTVLAGTVVDGILVFVNGICLVPTDDYTISGTTLTFTTAPANGAEIVFRYLGY